MKLTRYFFALAMLLTVTAFTQLQAQSAKDLMARKWKLDVESLIKSLPEAQQKEMKNAPPEQLALFKKMFGQSYFHFKADGSFEANMMGKKSDSEGVTWKLADGGKTLVTTENGKENRVKIIELTKKKLVIEADEGKGPQRMIFTAANE